MSFNFADFDDEVIHSERLGYIQLITPQEYDLPFGLFIPKPECQISDFLPDTSWELHNQKFKRSNAPKEEVQGYIIRREPDPNSFGKFLTNWITVAVCRRTPIVVFGTDHFGNVKILDYYYDQNGEKTEKGKLCGASDSPYHYGVKYLIYLINNQFTDTLHEHPLQFKTRAAFSGAFGSELKLVYKEFNQAFFTAAEQAEHYTNSSQLGNKALSCVLFSFRIGLKESEISTGQSGALRCYIAERLSPTCDPAKIGKSEIVNRKAGNGFNQIRIHYVDWQTQIATKDKHWRDLIVNAYEKYSDWGSLNKDEAGDRPEEVEVKPHYQYQSETSETTAIPIDREKLMTNSWAYIQELGWGQTEAVNFLRQMFRKTNRHSLSDKELEAFTQALEKRAIAMFTTEKSALIPKAQTQLIDRAKLMQQSSEYIKQLGWSNQRAIGYLQSFYKKSKRDDLSDKEFLDFVGKLQQMVLTSQPSLNEFM